MTYFEDCLPDPDNEIGKNNHFWTGTRIISLVFCLLWFQACAAPPAPKPPAQSGPARGLTAPITLLPALDDRQLQSSPDKQDVSSGVAVTVSADEITRQAESVWKKAGLDLRPYTGPLPPEDQTDWSVFPVRDLTTDLGLGLEIKSFDLKKSDPNALLPARALLDSALMPFFAVGSVATDGHYDLAGRLVPSSTVNYAVQVDLNFLSRLGGGLIFTKAYVMNVPDKNVTEGDLYDGLRPAEEDGRDLSRQTIPRVLAEAFSWMARDPELALMPRLAETYWLGEILTDRDIPATDRLQALSRAANNFDIPDFSPEQLGRLEVPAQNWSADSGTPASSESRGRMMVFEKTVLSLLDALAALEKDWMVRPLTGDEQALLDELQSQLSRTERSSAANQFLRSVILDPKVGWIKKRAALSILARDQANWQNGLFIRNLIQNKARIFGHGTIEEQKEAFALLLAAKGEMDLADYQVPREVILGVLSGHDDWAASLVVENLKSGDFDADLVRLAGALKLTEALPVLLKGLETGERERSMLSINQPRPVIPLRSSGLNRTKPISRPDPVTITRALGCYSGRPEVVNTLRAVLRRWSPGDDDDLAAEAVLSLGRLQDRETAPVAFDKWRSAFAAPGRAPLLRRASLEALAFLAGPETWDRILKIAREKADAVRENNVLSKVRVQALEALTETADFFGWVGYGPAVDFLVSLIRLPEGTGLLDQAAFNSLSRIRTPEAETALKTLAADPRIDLAQKAGLALEGMAVEKARLAELDRRRSGSAPDKAAGTS